MAARIKLGNAELIKKLRDVIGALDPQFGGPRLYSYLEINGPVSRNTVRSAEEGGSCNENSFEGMADGFSCKLLELFAKHPTTKWFDALLSPDLGWLIERLQRDEKPIRPEDLMMDHEERYFVGQYNVRLAVRPTIGRVEHIPRAGQNSEAFSHDDIASVTYDVTFPEKNRRAEPGFRLAYGTHNGRIKILEPDERLLVEDKAYRLHKRNAVFEPSPCVNASHLMRLAVYGGYSKGHEDAHFSMAQHAYYQHVSFTLDLSAYPDAALEREPELIIVPVLKDKKLDCCDIARKGQGLPVDPDRLELRLMPALNDMRTIPRTGKYLTIVAVVKNLLYFRSFDGHGNMVVDTDEQKLTESARQIESLKRQLNDIWPSRELADDQKKAIVAAVDPIVGYIHRDPRQNGKWQWSFIGLVNVQICVRWKIDHTQIGESGSIDDEALRSFLNDY